MTIAADLNTLPECNSRPRRWHARIVWHLVSACALVPVLLANAQAQSDNAVVPAIPGLVVAAPNPPAGAAAPPAAPPPGVFVQPPTPPRPSSARTAPPKPVKRKASPSSTTRANKTRSANATSSAPKSASTRIVALVNDEPITGYEVEQRSRFLALSTNITDRARANMKSYAQDPRTNERLKAILKETIAANRGKTREQVIAAFEARKKAYVTSLQKRAVESARSSILPTLKTKALDELIEERLKMQEAKKLSIKVEPDEVAKIFADMAKRNKMTSAEFESHIASQGASANVIKSRLRATLAWRSVVRRRYGHHINVSQRDVERLAAQSSSEAAMEMRLHRITLSAPGNVDQQALARRLIEANAMRSRFKGCTSTAGLAKGQANARFEDLGYKNPQTISEPTRSLLMAAKDGEMLPANLGASGVELYAVCDRRSQGIDEDSRQAAESKLTMQEFEKLAQRYIYDLRKDALIEMR